MRLLRSDVLLLRKYRLILVKMENNRPIVSELIFNFNSGINKRLTVQNILVNLNLDIREIMYEALKLLPKIYS